MKKIIVICVIAFFVGMVFQPVFAVNTNVSSKENNTSDNDFFNKLIMLDSFHDIGIKNITSPEGYIQPGTESIDVIVVNNGTFPEFGLTCYAEIWEYISDPENGSLVYEDEITDIDLDEPFGGTEMLNFKDFTFAYEGIYCLYLDLPLEIDDFPENNQRELVIGVDDTKPESSHTLDPPIPDGENGWYVNDVEVSVSAYDMYSMGVSSGVDRIKYRINDGSTQTITGASGTFLITQDHDKDDVKVEYWAIDNVGNNENSNTFYIAMDQTPPIIDFPPVNPGYNWKVICVVTTDFPSGMKRLEIYFNDELKDIVINPPIAYYWEFRYPPDENIIFKAVAYDKAGNCANASINIFKLELNKNSGNKSSNLGLNNVEDCNCQEVDKYNPFTVKLLLNNVKFVTNFLLSRFEHVPEVKENCYNIFDILDSYNPLSIVQVICAIAIGIYLEISSIFKRLWEFQEYLIENHPIFGIIYAGLLYISLLPIMTMQYFLERFILIYCS